MMKLSKLELRALSALAGGGSAPVNGLASRLGVSIGLASRCASKLEKKGLVAPSKSGASKILALSESRHAQEFKRLFQSRPNAGLDWLCGFGLEVLVLSGDGIAENWLDEAGCSKTTLNKTLASLRSAGVLASLAGKLVVPDGLARSFANSCADWEQLEATRGLEGYNVSVRVRKNIVLRTESKPVQEWMVKTGLSALISSGLNLAPTSYTDYYYSLDKNERELSIEEKFIHALVLSTLPQHAADRTALALFLASQNKLDYGRLAKLSSRYLVESQLEQLRRVNELREKIDSL